jgi:hypothetical protein
VVPLTGDVLSQQARLKAWGFDPGPLDGVMGSKTEAAIRAFQKTLGVTSNGVVGPWLWKKLLADPPVPVPVEGAGLKAVEPKATDNPHLAIQILVNECGWKEFWAKAYVGHAQRESYPDLKPHIEGDWMLDGHPVKKGTPGAVSTAYGINQWRGSRKAELEAFAAKRGTKWDDFETQVLFADYELKTSEKLAWLWLQRAEDLTQAVQALCFYERPKGYISTYAKACKSFEDVKAVALACDGYAARLAFAKAL